MGAVSGLGLLVVGCGLVVVLVVLALWLRAGQRALRRECERTVVALARVGGAADGVSVDGDRLDGSLDRLGVSLDRLGGSVRELRALLEGGALDDRLGR